MSHLAEMTRPHQLTRHIVKQDGVGGQPFHHCLECLNHVLPRKGDLVVIQQPLKLHNGKRLDAGQVRLHVFDGHPCATAKVLNHAFALGRGRPDAAIFHGAVLWIRGVFSEPCIDKVLAKRLRHGSRHAECGGGACQNGVAGIKRIRRRYKMCKLQIAQAFDCFVCGECGGIGAE